MTHMEDLVREAFLAHEDEAPDGADLLDSVHERLSGRRRGSRAVAALVAAFVVVAIVATVAAVAGSNHRSETPTTIAPAPTTPAPVATVHTTTSQPTTTTSGATLAECVRPTIAVYKGVYFSPPPLDGPSLDYLMPRMGNPKSSSNGVTIRYPEFPDTVLKIDRPDGTLGLRDASLGAIDDFDGDGRADVVVAIRVDSDDIWYIVPGSTPVGTYDIAAVGIRLPVPPPAQGNFAGPWYPVGDQNRDGADDLMVNDRVYSGRELMDASPGEALAALPAPFRTLEYVLAGVVQLNPSGPPTMIEIVADGSALVFDDRDGRPQRLVGLEARTAQYGPLIDSSSATGYNVDGHRIVQYSNSSRSGGNYWRWDLDSECAGS